MAGDRSASRPSRSRCGAARPRRRAHDPGAGASRVTHIVGQAASRGATRCCASSSRSGPRRSARTASSSTRPACGCRSRRSPRKRARDGPLDVVGTYDGNARRRSSGRLQFRRRSAIDVDVDRETGAFEIAGRAVRRRRRPDHQPGRAPRTDRRRLHLRSGQRDDGGDADRRERQDRDAESRRVQAADDRRHPPPFRTVLVPAERPRVRTAPRWPAS